MTAWAQEDDDRLTSMAASGASGADIAKALQRSRNAVLGRGWRLGISFSGERKPGGKTRQLAVNGVRKPRVAKRQLFPRVVYTEPVSVQAVPPANDSTAPPVTLYDLEEGMCKWPVGTMFCGCKAMPRKPYCPQHQYTSKQPKPLGTPKKTYDEPRRNLRSGRW